MEQLGTRHDGLIILYPKAAIPLEHDKSGLIRPHDLHLLLQSPIFMLLNQLKRFPP